jgi:hypothetical protein
VVCRQRTTPLRLAFQAREGVEMVVCRQRNYPPPSRISSEGGGGDGGGGVLTKKTPGGCSNTTKRDVSLRRVARCRFC